MSHLSLPDYCAFLNTHVGVQRLLAENHSKMQALLGALATQPWAQTTAMEAYVHKLEEVLKGIQSLTQKEWGYWLNHRACLQCLAPSGTRVGYSHYRLMLNSCDQLYTFLEQHYLRIQILLAMISSQDVWPEHCGAEAGLAHFSKYLSLNQSLNMKVLQAVKKIIKGWEALCATDCDTVEISGSEQLHNLMAYCNRWGSAGGEDYR